MTFYDGHAKWLKPTATNYEMFTPIDD